VWSYGSINHPTTFNYPAFTIEAMNGTPVRVKWINDLVDANGNYLPHILPVDPSLHWANPIGMMPDTRPPSDPADPYWSNSLLDATGRYVGPVPMTTHVHGAHTYDWADGYAESWYLPAGSASVPGINHTAGTFWNFFSSSPMTTTGPWTFDGGFSTYDYPNDQRATTLWYHDHTLGMTRLNVYAGPAGFYLIRGGADDVVIDKKGGAPATLPGPAPGLNADPFGPFREIPVAIQDRSFNADGSLFFPDNRAFFEGLNQPPTAPYLDIPFIPAAIDGMFSDISPIWNPEFFGNTMVVNGRTWPYLDVEPQRYRFRFLNGCNSRFLILRLVTATNINDPATWVQVPLPFSQIGTEGGFLDKNQNLNELLIGLAERADVIMDFGKFAPGTVLYLINVGPDSPFGGGVPGVDFLASDPATTGQVMQFRVGPKTGKGPDTTTPPGRLRFPTITPINAVGASVRPLSLNEMDSNTVFVTTDVNGNVVFDSNSVVPFGPKAALLGTMDAAGMPMPEEWMSPITEHVAAAGDTEVWEFYNFTMDAHPIHLHQVMFQVVDRQNLVLDPVTMMAAMPAQLSGASIPPQVWETGFKDTVIAYPGQVTRIKASFDLNGLYVWHCHIVDHEDNEMMRPYFVGDTMGYPTHLFTPMSPMPGM
jgi:bilirubin oxidase